MKGVGRRRVWFRVATRAKLFEDKAADVEALASSGVRCSCLVGWWMDGCWMESLPQHVGAYWPPCATSKTPRWPAESRRSADLSHHHCWWSSAYPAGHSLPNIEHRLHLRLSPQNYEYYLPFELFVLFIGY